nr:flagellar biosynthetic protein FliQ [Providencia sneebia]
MQEGIFIFSISFVLTGIVVGLLQTVFSVQDPGLPLVAKLVVLFILLTHSGKDIYEQFQSLFKVL